MKIAVLGANGRVSNEVARAFLAHGHEVIAVTRNGKTKGLTGKIQHRAADALIEADVIKATQGADMIFNGLNPLYHEWEAKAMPMARNVMAAARAHHIPHLFIGNVYNYGTAITVNTVEDGEKAKDVRKGQIREDMEDLFRRDARDHQVQTIILRAGDFYGGKGTGSWFDQAIATKVDKGVMTWPGPLDRLHAFAYLPDLAEAFVTIAENMANLAMFDTFNFTGHSLTGADFKAIMEKVVGQPLKTASVPWWLFRVIGPFKPIMGELAKMAYLWQIAHSLNGAKFAGQFGTPKTTAPADAITQALIDLGKLPQPIKMAA